MIGACAHAIRRQLLDQGDIDRLYQFISVENKKVRHEGAAFINKHLFEQVIGDQVHHVCARNDLN